MKALLKFENGARELPAEPEAKDEQTEIHDILLERIRRIADMKPDDKDFQKEIAKARTVAEMSEQIIKHGMYTVAINRIANGISADVKLPRFLLG
jgi:cobalamin biosynthesis protein CbiD